MKHLKLFKNRESMKGFNNFINERRENKLDYREFIAEVEKRVVDVDRNGNPRDEEGKLYWSMSVNRDIDGHDSYLCSPMELLYRAYSSGLYELDDISDQSLGRAGETLGNESTPEGHGFGSSDWTYLLQSFMRGDGVRTEFINGRLERLTEDEVEVYDAHRSIPWTMRSGIGQYNDEYKAKKRKHADALVDKGLAVKTGKKDGRGEGENEYALTEEGEKLSAMELAEIATGKKIQQKN